MDVVVEPEDLTFELGLMDHPEQSAIKARLALRCLPLFWRLKGVDDFDTLALMLLRACLSLSLAPLLGQRMPMIPRAIQAFELNESLFVRHRMTLGYGTEAEEIMPRHHGDKALDAWNTIARLYHSVGEAFRDNDILEDALKIESDALELNSTIPSPTQQDVVALLDNDRSGPNLMGLELFPNTDINVYPGNDLIPLGDHLNEESKPFSFWREWYLGFVIGNPLDWELQRRVALIDNAIWEAGPEAVTEEIERIKADRLAEQLLQAERIEFDHETAKFRAVPLEIAKPDLLGATLSQVADALDDVMASPSNGLHDNAREVRVLRRVFAKYGNDPQQIEMGFVSVQKGLTRQILNEELPASEENLALQEALEEGARAIRATHPEVAENRKILSEQAFRELPEGAKEQLEEALPLLRAISDEDLAEDWAQDIPHLINDATLPLPSGAPPLPGTDEATRIFSRVAKISLLMKSSEIVHRIDGSAGYKAGNIVLTLAGLVALGLSLIG